MVPSRKRRRLRRAALVVAAFPPLAAAFFALRGAWEGYGELHPPRLPPRASSAPPELAGMEEVSFRTADGVRLSGWWRRGAGDAAVLLAHGWGGNREQMLSQAGRLARDGFGVLLFDLRGHGSSGSRGGGGEREPLDVEAARSFLEGEPGVRWIAAVGYSLGGVAVGLAAARDPRIRAAVLEGAPPTLDAELEAEYGGGGPLEVWAARATLRLLGVHPERVRLVDRVAAVAPRPLLLVYGRGDELTPPDSAERIREAAGPSAALWLFPGRGHADLLAAPAEELPRRVAAFVAQARARDPELPPGPAAPR